MINYGILSTASIVPRFVGAVNKSKNAKVSAIASRSYEKAENLAKELGIPNYYGEYEKLYEDDNIDIIYIATINSEHYKNAKDALSAGKNVLLEKPMTLTKTEASELFMLAKKKNLFLMEAQKEVFLPVINEVKELISRGEIGDIHLLDYTTSFPRDYNDWMFSKRHGGGVLYTNAIYSIEHFEHLFERDITDFTLISTTASDKKEDRLDGDDQSVITLKMDNDVIAVSKISARVKAVNRLIIYGTKGRVELDNFYRADKAVFYYNDKKESKIITHKTEFEMLYEVEHVNECLERGEIVSDIMTPHRTVHAIEILEKLSKMM